MEEEAVLSLIMLAVEKALDPGLETETGVEGTETAGLEGVGVCMSRI